MGNKRNPYKDVLLGVAVGDALGVPVEFKSRSAIKQNPVTDMSGFGTYHQPPGTWSDDSSLTFCLADALTVDFNLQKIADNFVLWMYENFWRARGVVFDVGITTKEAIDNIAKGCQPDLAGGWDEQSNGNGSLMRISPLLFYIKDKPIDERFEIIRKVSSITHGHIRATIACFYYLEFARMLLEEKNKFEIYKELKILVTDFLLKKEIDSREITLFNNLLKKDIFNFPEEKN
jgi:ADP-ribosylglycohydrolase